MTDIMIRILDDDARSESLTGTQPGEVIETEIDCREYRSGITSGILIDGLTTSISFNYVPQKKNPEDFSSPSIIVFDSYDRRVHNNYKSIDAYKYMEYGELWFDGHSISTAARNMEVVLDDIEDISGWPEGKHVIYATKYEDHVKISMTDGSHDMDVTIALPDSSKYASIAITGENCHISDITVDKNDIETTEGDVERIAEKVSYIDHMESDIPNVQVDRHRSAYTNGIELKESMSVAFHTMSLPASNLVWHCPYVVLFYSEDGTVGGQGYKEYALIHLNGEIDKSEMYAHNSFSMKRESEFPGWDSWKSINKQGMECEVFFRQKGNTVTLKTKNLGVVIQNTTTIVDGGDKVYAALTGDMVALTDIRII